MALGGLHRITWYMGIELAISLLFVFRRRRGLYFWSCVLVACGALSNSVFGLLLEYCLWPEGVPVFTLIFISWGMMVVSQSCVLYSRLHLLMPGATALKVIKRLLISSSIILFLPGLVICIVSQARPSDHKLTNIYMVWGRVQLVAFLIQETALCTLYMVQALRYLSACAPLYERTWSAPSSSRDHHLTIINIFIILVDIASLGIMLANLFYMQAAVNSCVHAVKLKVEFAILNRLRDPVSYCAAPGLYIANDAAVVESSLPDMGRGEGADSGVQLVHSPRGS
ncbi:integral membrane protein [Aspergillus germanicus]